jgi:hypothetical protein
MFATFGSFEISIQSSFSSFETFSQFSPVFAIFNLLVLSSTSHYIILVSSFYPSIWSINLTF